MEKNKAFNIIIAVYNCEKYIKRCIKSVLNQDFKDFEIIIVDDGSDDKSGTICDSFAKRDSRVKVFHIENSGVSKARNIGLDNVNSKYVLFLDSDDYIDENYLNTAFDLMENKEIDLLNFGFYSDVEKNGKTISSDLIFANEKYYSSKEEFNSDLVYLWDMHMLYNIWNKVYKATIIKENRIKFFKQNFAEDMEFNKNYLNYCNTVYNSKKAFYHYFKERVGSITNKYNEDLFNIRVREYYEFNKYFEMQGIEKEKYIEFSSRRFIERVLGCVENITSSKINLKGKKEKIKSIVNNSLVKETILIAKPKSKKIKIMLYPIKIKNSFLCIIFYSTISLIRSKFPAIFNSLKNRR